jgi:hypothetical protein
MRLAQGLIETVSKVDKRQLESGVIRKRSRSVWGAAVGKVPLEGNSLAADSTCGRIQAAFYIKVVLPGLSMV